MFVCCTEFSKTSALEKHQSLGFSEFSETSMINIQNDFWHKIVPDTNLKKNLTLLHQITLDINNWEMFLFLNMEYGKDQRFLSSDICLTTFTMCYILVFNLKSYHILPFSLKAIVMLQDAAL